MGRIGFEIPTQPGPRMSGLGPKLDLWIRPGPKNKNKETGALLPRNQLREMENGWAKWVNLSQPTSGWEGLVVVLRSLVQVLVFTIQPEFGFSLTWSIYLFVWSIYTCINGNIVKFWKGKMFLLKRLISPLHQSGKETNLINPKEICHWQGVGSCRPHFETLCEHLSIS